MRKATTLRGGGAHKFRKKLETRCGSSEQCRGGNVKKATAVVTQNGCVRTVFFEGCEMRCWEAPSVSINLASASQMVRLEGEMQWTSDWL